MKEEAKSYGQCPFDPTHVVEYSKIKKHIDKCRSPNRADFVQCQFNPYHWTHFTQITHHEKYCGKNKDRAQEPPPVQISAILKESDLEGYSDIRSGLNGSGMSESINQREFLWGVKKEEEKERGKDGLWKEPSFGQWYHKVIRKDKEPQKNHPLRSNNLGFDDSF